MTSKEAQKGGRQELGWNGTGSTNPREGSPRKNWLKGSQTWTTKNGMLMIKGGRERRKVSCRNQMSMTKERMMGTAGDFRTNTWWRNLGPRAKKRRRTKKEGGQEPFRLHYHQEGIHPILRKETSHERSTSEPQSFKMSYLRPWGKNKKPWPWRSIWTYSEGISHKRKSAREL